MTATTEQETENTITAVEQAEAPQDSNGAKSPSNRRIFVSLIIIALFILVTLAFWYWWDDLNALITFVSDQEAFGDYLRSFGVLAPLALFVAQIIQVFIAFIPGHVVSISGGYVFGFAWGLIMNLSFTVFASQMAYYLARYAGRPIVYKLTDRETVDYWERVANQKGTMFFTIAFSASVTFFGADADAAINWAWEPVPFMLSGPEAPLWVTLAFADWLVKLSLALIALIPFKVIVARLTAAQPA